MGKRFREHKRLLRRGEHHSKSLQKAWKKWGEKMFAFFFIEETSKKKLLEREQYWISTLKVFNPSIGFNRNKFKP